MSSQRESVSTVHEFLNSDTMGEAGAVDSGQRFRMQKMVARMQAKRLARRGGTKSQRGDSNGTKQSVQQESFAQELRHLYNQSRYSISPADRLNAIRCLLWLRPYAEMTINAVKLSLQDKDSSLRAATLAELQSYETTLPKSLGQLVVQLAWDPDIRVRKQAVRLASLFPCVQMLNAVLGLLGTPDPELFDAVVQAVNCISQKLDGPHGDM
ncbi:MAG: hypothetical protein EP343_30070 [Deltaproteobacteria bacterium]|nr:MAG: hypothetical protein EP343_30070 [Deltaproteobacteria bacterium]